MNFNQIQLLSVLQASDFNLSKAAEKMHVVQSAVSRQLQLFENEMGGQLFERHGKKLVALTPLGKKILDEVNFINQAKSNIQMLATDFLENRNCSLRIATTHAQAKYLLPVPVQKFRAKFPHIKIYLMQSSPEKLIEMLYTQQADMAVCTEKLDEDHRLMVTPCYAWHHLAIMPKNHPQSAAMTLEWLSGQPILTYSHGYTGRSKIEAAFAAKDLPLNVILAAADSDVIKTYVRLGMGIGIIAETSYDPVKDSDLLAVSLAGLIPGAVTKIACLQQHYLPAYCQYFIKELLAEANLKKLNQSTA